MQPKTPLSSRSPRQVLVGLDVGATKIAGCVGLGEGAVIVRDTAPTVREQPEALIKQLGNMVDGLLLTAEAAIDAKSQILVGVGICGGVSSTGEVRSPVGLGWPEPVNVAEQLAARLDLPVFIENDVTAGAMGERAWGAGRGCDDFVYISIGTGIGAGLVLRGEVYRGANGWAGEIGHMSVDVNGHACPCGNRGCIETTAGGKGLANWVEADLRQRNHQGSDTVLRALLGQGRSITARDVFQAAQDGDAYAQRAVAMVCGHLAAAIVNTVNLLDVARVIVGGGMAQEPNGVLTPLRAALGRWQPSLSRSVDIVVPAGLGSAVGEIGAMAVALEGLVVRERSLTM